MQAPHSPALTLERVLRAWWPLAASWLLMGAELPLFTAFVARMPDPEIHLAAYGSVVFPVALLVEAPIIMLLAASTALSVDRTAYAKLARFVRAAGLTLTALHLLIVLTPLYDGVVHLLGVPAEVVEPARIGLVIMTPWTWSIAYRRFNQGVLIRFEQSRVVVLGTLVRVLVNALVLTLGLHYGELPGIVVGTTAVAVAVLSEAAFVGWCVRPVVRERLPEHDASARPLTRASFTRFYLPLALTPLITLLNQPLGSAAMSRMPEAIASLAAWPAVHGFVFLPRSLGFAYNEVVVALLGEPGAAPLLRRFALWLALATSAFLVIVALTPLADLWFHDISGLSPELTAIAAASLLYAAALPALQALSSWYQGALVFHRRTRGVTEAVAIYLVLAAAALGVGVATWRGTGIHFTLGAFTLGAVVQTLWLQRSLRRSP